MREAKPWICRLAELGVLSGFTIAFVLPILVGLSFYQFNADWARLSDINQAQSAIVVILNALILIGITISITLQIRDGRLARENTIQDLRHDLIPGCPIC